MNALPPSTKAVAHVRRRIVELMDWPMDASPLKPGEVAGRTIATLVSAGTEINGNFDVERTAPWVGGYAAVFEVTDVGSAVTDLRPGQQVLAMGPHAAWQRMAREEVVPLPPELSPITATFARMMSVSWTTLTTTAARPPDRVLIAGLGLVGNLAAQMFRSAGYRVTAVDALDRRRQFANCAGIADVRAAVCGEKDLIDCISLAIECSGNEQTILDCCRVVAKGGEVVLVGVPWRKRSDVRAFDVVHAIFHRYVTLRSGWEWELPRRATEFRSGSVYGNFAAAMDWLAERRVSVDGMYRIFRPAQAQEVYDSLCRRDNEFLTAVFDWQGEEIK
jgi:threonine dehydrogenase-like Zn-dependent dehydrogenase